MIKPTLISGCLALMLLPLGASAQSSARMRTFSLVNPALGTPSVPRNYECSSANSTRVAKKCSTPLSVTVLIVPSVTDPYSACLVALPYDTITVHTSTAGESVTLTYNLMQPAGLPKDAAAVFESPGLVFTSPSGYPTGNLLTVTNQPGNQTVVVATNADAKLSMLYNHQPAVTLNLVTSEVKCQGIDPIFVNSAD